MAEGYHDYERWDIRGTIRRCAFYLTKGVEEKEKYHSIHCSTARLDRRGGKRPKEPSRTEHEPT
jgi:hypothetical protein